MTDIISRLNGGELIGLVAVVGGFLSFCTCVVVCEWRKYKVSVVEADLKQDMLERGMTAEEIDQVVRSKTTASIP